MQLEGDFSHGLPSPDTPLNFLFLPEIAFYLFELSLIVPKTV